MAGQANKKQVKKQEVKNATAKITIIFVTVIYILLNIYNVKVNEMEYTSSNTMGFLFLTIINFALYRAIDMFDSDSYLYMPLIDLLIINLSVMILINFHWKFWFLYLVVPGYFLLTGSAKLFEYVKTIGKPSEDDEEIDPRAQKQNSQKEKKKEKYVKVR